MIHPDLVAQAINKNMTINEFYNLISEKGSSISFDINLDGRLGWSLLQAACKCENIPLVRVLIRMGAHVNHQRDGNMTALYDAISNQNLALVKILVENGARLNRTCGNYKNAIAFASAVKNKQIVNYLFSTMSLKDRLLYLIEHDEAYFQALLNYYLDTDCEFKKKAESKSALELSSFLMQWVLPEDLSQNIQFESLTLDLLDQLGFKPFYENDLYIANKILEEECINLNFVTESAKPILIFVGEKGYFEMVKLLVKHGVTIYEHDVWPSIPERIRQAGYEEIAVFLEDTQKERYRILQEEAQLELDRQKTCFDFGMFAGNVKKVISAGAETKQITHLI